MPGLRWATRIVGDNSRRIERLEGDVPNPRDAGDLAWHRHLVDQLGVISAEWSAFAASGGRLPHIDDVLGEDQGNLGPWRVGVLRVGGDVTTLGRESFPATVAALGVVPGLQAALWSVLEPGTELTEHSGPNGGVLRYHLGIDCPTDAALRVGDVTVPFRNGEGILFDDTAPHSAWNRSAATRVTLFCEIERPLPGVAARRNRAVQAAMAAVSGRRRLVGRADEWHRALNPHRHTPAPEVPRAS